MEIETIRKMLAILAKLRNDVPVTPAGVELRHAMDRTILALDAFRTEAAAGPPGRQPTSA
jgi:hypothetical protein